MAKANRSRVGRTRGTWSIPLIAVLVVVLCAVGAYRLGYLNEAICDGPCPAQFVDPPAALAVSGLVVSAPADLKTVLTRKVSGHAIGAKIEEAVAPLLASSPLGSRVGFTALDLETGSVLWSNGDEELIPASTNKLFTTFAALTAMEPQHRFATTVKLVDPDSIVLVGGGDPYLRSEKQKKTAYPQKATLPALAAKTAAALDAANIGEVSLGYDTSLFSGPSVSPEWPASYVTTNVVTRITALWADQGVVNGVRVRDPARVAAADFAAELEKRDIAVNGAPEKTKAPESAPPIASVLSPTVHQIVELVNLHSDNEGAEVLFRHVALATGHEGSFAGGRKAVTAVLKAAEIDLSDTQIVDGSGLSRNNHTTTSTLAHTLYAASQRTRTKILLSDLPVAGFNGTLADRFDVIGAPEYVASARGEIRAKTGTLTGVQGLAGVAVDAQGHRLIFTLLANDVRGLGLVASKTAVDRIAAALTACRCG